MRRSLLERITSLDHGSSGASKFEYSGNAFGKHAVLNSPDLQRITALPRRRPPTFEEQQSYARYMTDKLRFHRKTPCICKELRPNVPNPCITELFPIQGWYLYEAMTTGILGSLVIGAGKTGIGILLPMISPGAKRAVLLIPSNLRPQMALDYQAWSQHFRVPNLAGGRGHFYQDRPVLHVLAYTELSHKNSALWFANNEPDIIIGDEIQHLKSVGKSTRVSRFMMHFTRKPNTKFYCHSGSLTTKSLNEYAHLSMLALREGSPLPEEASVIKEWCGALDPSPPGGVHTPPGALLQLCKEGETPREGFCRRLIQTPGVITTEDAQLSIELKFFVRQVQMPEELRATIALVRSSQQRPDGEELKEAVEIDMTCNQLASGFYYRWKYPRGEPEELINEWFKKRQAWNRELRDKLMYRSDLLDSPALCTEAGKRYLNNYSGALPVWKTYCLEEWLAIEDKVQPVQDVVWVDDFLARDAALWGKTHIGIVWYRHSAFGAKVRELSRMPFYGAGAEASEGILQERGDRSIIASVKAHGTGKNLQYAFSRNLLGNAISNGGEIEQVLGRTMRYGQKEDTVEVYWYRHAPEYRDAIDTARSHAEYVHQTTGKLERILCAEFE